MLLRLFRDIYFYTELQLTCILLYIPNLSRKFLKVDFTFEPYHLLLSCMIRICIVYDSRTAFAIPIYVTKFATEFHGIRNRGNPQLIETMKRIKRIARICNTLAMLSRFCVSGRSFPYCSVTASDVHIVAAGRGYHACHLHACNLHRDPIRMQIRARENRTVANMSKVCRGIAEIR